MFTFLKSKKSVIKTIEAIHNEFDNAGQRLLEEAKEILSGKELNEKGERLKKLGFTGAKAVVRNREISEHNDKVAKENEERKKSAKWVEYYAQWYPLHKFITKDIVKQICDKYNLYCGPVASYKADVPLKNIAEMEQFKLRKEDMKIETGLDRWYSLQFMGSIGNIFGFPMPEFRSAYNHLTTEQYQKLKEEKHYIKDSFEICAPEKDFDMTRMTKKGRFLIPDPIVLQPVPGGYLIVTKWGLEASDELVVNDKQN